MGKSHRLSEAQSPSLSNGDGNNSSGPAVIRRLIKDGAGKRLTPGVAFFCQNREWLSLFRARLKEMQPSGTVMCKTHEFTPLVNNHRLLPAPVFSDLS